MSPNQLLKQVRRDRNLTLEAMAETLGMTTQRLSQWERGDSIPPERIQIWANDKRLPEWARALAYQLWLASLEQQYGAIGEQMQVLGQLVADHASAVAFQTA